MRVDVEERKAIARYLVVRAARALVHRSKLPWWAWMRRCQAEWSAVHMAIAAEEIERGAHLDEQSSWTTLLSDESRALIEAP